MPRSSAPSRSCARGASSSRSPATPREPLKFDVAILGSQPIPVIVEQVRLAESLGFDTAWITDTHLVCRELWVTLTACALATSRIRLGPGITVPHTRHISVTASAALSLEELAPGRVVVGVGTGGSAAQTMGLTIAQTARTATLETMAASLRALTQNQPMRFEAGIEGRVAWLRAPRAIPIYAAGSGPRMLASAGRVGDGVIMYASVEPDILKAGLGHVAAGAREAGRSLADLDVALWAPTSVSEDGDLARDHARGRVASALRHPLPVPFSDEDRPVVERLRREYDAFQHATAASRHRELVPDRLVRLMALAGTPSEVRAQVARVATVPEIRRVILLPQVPDAGFVPRESILTLFANEIMGRTLC